ncbi:hypothetical protein BJ546DRAFT_696788 [Cryomyces antarcticus]
MFKKKPNIKPLAPLRSSDRRRTADQIIADYDLKVPTGDEVSPEEKAASTAKHTELRNSLLPDNAQSARFTTTHGPDLKKVSGTVYVGSHAGEEQRVLWVKIEERMYPTVYTLWHNPGILPLLHTHPPVVQKLQGGADLMTPGLAGRPPFPLKAKKGSITAIASTESPSVPVVVGVCEIDVSALQQVQGAKGHAVHTIHWCGDELWAWSSSGKPGGAAPERLDGWDEHTEEDEMAEQTEKMDLENGEEDGGVALGGDEPAVQKTSERIDYVEGEDAPTQSEADADEREMTTNEIDEAFRKAFFYGVHHHVIANKDLPTHGLQFPLSQSFVMSNLVQPFLPAFTPSQSNSLQIKKTSWKNIKKFLKSLDKEKVLRCKDRDGNEVVVQDIDFTDRAVVDFVPYRLPKKETAAGTSVGRGGKATTTGDESDESIGQTLKVVSI